LLPILHVFQASTPVSPHTTPLADGEIGMNHLRLSVFIACTMLAAAGTASEGTAVDDLAWIGGHWCADNDRERIEEYWMPPRGGR
jgi:hypothetical protein